MCTKKSVESFLPLGPFVGRYSTHVCLFEKTREFQSTAVYMEYSSSQLFHS